MSENLFLGGTENSCIDKDPERVLLNLYLTEFGPNQITILGNTKENLHRLRVVEVRIISG